MRNLPAAEAVVMSLRQHITEGVLTPGTRLVDAAMARSTGSHATPFATRCGCCSTKDCSARAQCGYSVRTLSAADVRDIYAGARVIEVGAVQRSASATDEQLERIADAVSLTERYLRDGDWSKVGTASLGFHRTVVELAASPRLNRFFATVAAQLRLAFAVIPDERTFQLQWVSRDRTICDLILAGARQQAAEALDVYLSDSEDSDHRRVARPRASPASRLIATKGRHDKRRCCTHRCAYKGPALEVAKDFYGAIAREVDSRIEIESFVVPIRSGKAWRVPAGHVCRIRTVDGPQVGDLNVWIFDNRGAVLGSGTRQVQRARHDLRRLWSSLPYAATDGEIVADTLRSPTVARRRYGCGTRDRQAHAMPFRNGLGRRRIDLDPRVDFTGDGAVEESFATSSAGPLYAASVSAATSLVMPTFRRDQSARG